MDFLLHYRDTLTRISPDASCKEVFNPVLKGTKLGHQEIQTLDTATS